MEDTNQIEMDIDRTIQLVKANSHPIKVKLMLLLRIYHRLSTSELVEITKKSKPTVLKHLEELENLEQVAYDREISPGAYDRRIYYLTQPSWLIQGQNLREYVRQHPEIALIYANYQLAIRSQLKEIIDLSVSYQKRLIKELESLVKQNDGDSIIALMQDHLGQYSTKYSSEFAETGKGNKESNDYLRIELLLPIRRIIEQMAIDEWVKDGTIWKGFQ